MLYGIPATSLLVILSYALYGFSQTSAYPPEVMFELSPRTFGTTAVYEAGLADFDWDVDLDAVFLNNSSGAFTQSAKNIGDWTQASNPVPGRPVGAPYSLSSPAGTPPFCFVSSNRPVQKMNREATITGDTRPERKVVSCQLQCCYGRFTEATVA